MTPLISIIIIVIAAAIGSFGALFIKKGSKHFTIKKPFNKDIVIGVLLYGISTLLFIPALKLGELSVLYPFVATGYIWIIMLSKKYLNESITLTKIISIALIIIGVSFIGFGS
ncbi:MAG: hypothetical protein AB1571_00770 [Nanoarchaeota archaeon]